MTYVIKCCNCYFDMYLLEISKRPEIMDTNQRSFLSIIRIRKKRKEWKSKNDLLERWLHINGEIIFHLSFECVRKVL